MLNKNKQCKCKEKISFAGKEGFCAKCCLPFCHQEPPEEECKHEIENNMCEPYCRKCKIPLPPSKCEQWEGEFAENFLDLDELWYKADPKQVKSFISSLLAKQKEEERQRVLSSLRVKVEGLKKIVPTNDRRCSWCIENNFASCTVCEDQVEGTTMEELYNQTIDDIISFLSQSI